MNRIADPGKLPGLDGRRRAAAANATDATATIQGSQAVRLRLAGRTWGISTDRSAEMDSSCS
ncbi:MAG TPA: hypothetical protein VLE54_06025, partial [Thermoanaerobaculia bacterium]|nr:hypothetical protein [Thermoanaerobaculia bacterium]